MSRGINFDSPDWAPLIIAAAIVAFVVWVMVMTLDSEETPEPTLPTAVYVVDEPVTSVP